MKSNSPQTITHTDMDLFLTRMKLSNGQKIETLIKTRAALFGVLRGRMHQRFPELTHRELNLKVLEEL